MKTNYIYRIRRKSDGRFYRNPRPTEINRQFRRGRDVEYWGSENRGTKFYSIPEVMEYMSKDPELENVNDLELVPYEITYVECVSIPLNDVHNM